MKKTVFKRTLYLLTAAALWVGTAVPATAAGVGVSVGGNPVQWSDATPFIDANSRTMVPLRAVGDALGLTVDWDNNAREAIFSNGSKTIYFPIDKSVARTSESTTVTMDTAAVIVNDRTYAPVRYLAEYFGYKVDWNGASSTVVISDGTGGATTVGGEGTGNAVSEGLSFEELSTMQFTFMSGAGGWSTDLTIQKDGSFKGDFYDSDMGDSGEGYPDGVVYFCNFSGKFEEPVKVNDYTYSMKMQIFESTDPTGEPFIKDGIKYIPAGPYGLENTDEMLVFLPGTSVSDLPKEYVEWVSMPLAVSYDDWDFIDFYGLYNPVEKEGFSGL